MFPSVVSQSRVGNTGAATQIGMLAGESTAKRGTGSAASASHQNQNSSNNADVDSPAVCSCKSCGSLTVPQLPSLGHDTRACHINTTNSRRKRARFNEPHRYTSRLFPDPRNPEDHRLHDDGINSLLPNAPISYLVEGMVRSKFSERNLNESSSARRLEPTNNKALQGAFYNSPNDLVFNQSAPIRNNHDFNFTSSRSLGPREQLPWLLHTGSQTCSTRGLANTFSAESQARAGVTRISTSEGFDCNAFTDGSTPEIEYDPMSSALSAGRAADHMEVIMVEPGLFGKHHNSLSNRLFPGIEMDLCGAGATTVLSTSANDSDGWNYTSPTSFPYDLDSGSATDVLPSYSQGEYESTVSNTGFPPGPYQATLDSNDSTLVDTSEPSHQPCGFHDAYVSHLVDRTITTGISQSDISRHPDTLGYSEGIFSGGESVFNRNTLKELPDIGPVSWNNHAVTHADLNSDNANDLGLHLTSVGDLEVDHNSMDFPVIVGNFIQQHGIGCRELISTCK
jgi:hypothetical protein